MTPLPHVGVVLTQPKALASKEGFLEEVITKPHHRKLISFQKEKNSLGTKD